MTEPNPEELSFPSNWDRLRERTPEQPEETGAGDHDPSSPPTLSMVAAAWAELAAVLGVCTAALLTLLAQDHTVSLPCLPWALAVALGWWCAAAAVLVIVRRGTPGMLMAGVVFEDQIPPLRLPTVLATALLLGCTLGLPAVLGADRSLLRLAAGSALRIGADLGEGG
jgi:hypothetical protein